MAQDIDSLAFNDSTLSLQSLYIPESEFVVNPFPRYIVNLIQPVDSISIPKGILTIKYDSQETEVLLARDWSTIIIKEYIDGRSYRIPFSSSVEWYLKKYNKRTRFLNLIVITQKESMEGSSRR